MYEFYINEYKGSVIATITEFMGVINEATAYVDSFVSCRKNLCYTQIDRKYKMAICAAAEIIYQSTITTAAQKQSESVGNHSVTYRVKAAEEYNTEKRQKVLMYLRGTGLMYSAI